MLLVLRYIHSALTIRARKLEVVTHSVSCGPVVKTQHLRAICHNIKKLRFASQCVDVFRLISRINDYLPSQDSPVRPYIDAESVSCELGTDVSYTDCLILT